MKINRRSIRLKGYDYASPGAYFITLITWQRNELFGQVVKGDMVLSLLGEIAYDEWFHSVSIRREIRLFEDEFIVMPNHFHGIVWIVEPSSEEADSVWNAGLSSVGADGIRPDEGARPALGANHAPLQAHNDMNATPIPQRKPKSLSSFIAGYKSSVTSRATQELQMTNVWQRNYYDHIIRNDDDFSKIWDYIDNNIRKWDEDVLHPSKGGWPLPD